MYSERCVREWNTDDSATLFVFRTFSTSRLWRALSRSKSVRVYVYIYYIYIYTYIELKIKKRGKRSFRSGPRRRPRAFSPCGVREFTVRKKTGSGRLPYAAGPSSRNYTYVPTYYIIVRAIAYKHIDRLQWVRNTCIYIYICDGALKLQNMLCRTK